MSIDEKEVIAMAKKLANADGYGDDYTYKLDGGIAVPRWVTYISRAREVVILQKVMSIK